MEKLVSVFQESQGRETLVVVAAMLGLSAALQIALGAAGGGQGILASAAIGVLKLYVMLGLL